jgi:chaperonin cofactor prefoldin
MAISLADVQEMMGLLREHPQVRAQFQMLVVPPELIMLTERVSQLAVRVEQLAAHVTQLAEAQLRTEHRLDQLAEAQRRTEERLEQLIARVDQLTVRVDQLAEAQRRTEERLERLEATVQVLVEQVRDLVTWQRGEAGHRAGERYERAIIKRAPALFRGGQGGATDQPLVQQHISQLLIAGSAIDVLSDEDDPFLADLIWWKGDQYAVVEASLQVNGRDITRAARRANTIRRAGVRVIGIVIGEEWADPAAREQARALEVEWKVGDDLSAGFIEFRRLSG